MKKLEKKINSAAINRRVVLKVGAATIAASMMGGLSSITNATPTGKTAERSGESAKAFVYTELQLSVPFHQVPWQTINKELLQQPGLMNKTWFAGEGNDSLGGFYAFDSIDNALSFVTGYLPAKAKSLGAAQASRIFDALVVEEASRELGSPHFGVALKQNPGAFVYTEVQVNVPFEKAPWRKRNSVLKQQSGLLAKTWLSGLHTHTLGGIDVFDSVEQARRFALEVFPETAKRLNAAFYTRVFDASVTEKASRQMRSPYFA
ncbi:MAG: hypothetical protein ABW139_19810 [Candidatus Thiodiazotropha sp. DIVDIV]